jgi:hypothetical protein
MTASTDPAPQGWRVLGFGKHPEVAAAIQARLRSAGLRARNFALTDDEQGDAQLIRELAEEQYDGIAIGSFINGQDHPHPQPRGRALHDRASPERTLRHARPELS